VVKIDGLIGYEPPHDHGPYHRRVLVLVHPADDDADWILDSQYPTHEGAMRRMSEINKDDYN